MSGQNTISESLLEKRILLVDDEKDITDLLEEVLRKDGFINILKAASGQEAVNLCQMHRPDVIVLDIMLPDIDGIEICKKIREFSYCPIIFLSSKNDDIDKILGLSSGGDDYVTKPFSPREIVFRIKAQIRRQQYNRAYLNNEKLLQGINRETNKTIVMVTHSADAAEYSSRLINVKDGTIA